MSSSSSRIYFVDFARSFAIVLALTDHSMSDFNVWYNYPEKTFMTMKTLTSSATPTFLLLFGMMLELIYRRKLRKQGMRKMASQLVKRSFQCYVGYFLTCLAGVFGGLISWKGMAAAAVFFGNCHYGNILKLYTIVLLLAIPLVWFREKFGLTKTILLCVSPWIIYPLYAYVPPLQDNVAIFTSYFFGFGGKGGPSILNSLSLIAIGMLAASFISTEQKYLFAKRTSAILGVMLLLLAIVCIIVPPAEVLSNLTKNAYRYNNHPIYYIFTGSLALIVALVCSVIIPIGSKISKATDTFMAFGRSSLAAFSICNIILSLILLTIVQYHWNLLAPLTFVIVMFLILLFYEKIWPTLDVVKATEKAFRGVTVRFHWFFVRRVANSAAGVLN